ncbi:hypothetical protein CROQUDRAFT_9595, partial [Cronartium quercuum f. sp. fusiforme G11]
LDDILTYSKSDEEHYEHVRLVPEALAIAELHISGEKSEVYASEIQFVGLTVSSQGVRPMNDKMEAVRNWPRPESAHDVRALLGLTGY